MLSWLFRRETVVGLAVSGAALIIANLLWLAPHISKVQFTILVVVGGILILGPSLFSKWQRYRTISKLEERFPRFLEDVVDSTRSGMTLPLAIRTAAKHDHGPLNPYAKRIAAKIDWGLPFEEVLQDFVDEIESPLLARTVATIIETHRSGGNISEILDLVSETMIEISKIRKERSTRVYSQILNGYMIFFIFVGILIGLQWFLIPALTKGGLKAGIKEERVIGKVPIKGISKTLPRMFQHLVIIQGIFSGIAIGKMSRGTVIAGLKHSVVLAGVGFAAVFFFI